MLQGTGDYDHFDFTLPSQSQQTQTSLQSQLTQTDTGTCVHVDLACGFLPSFSSLIKTCTMRTE